MRTIRVYVVEGEGVSVDTSTLNVTKIKIGTELVPEGEEFPSLFMLSYGMNEARKYMINNLAEYHRISYADTTILPSENDYDTTVEHMQLFITNNPYEGLHQFNISAKCDFIRGVAVDMLKLGAAREYAEFMKHGLEEHMLEQPIEEIILCSFIRNIGIPTRDITCQKESE